MIISHHDLNRWKINSIGLALKFRLDKNILDFINRNTRLEVIHSLPPEGMWYGHCIYDKKHPVIEVYHRNLSTEDISIVIVALKKKGLPEKLIEEIVRVYNKVSKAKFFEIYNQSGMDHELIGHLYNHIAGKMHDEKAAVETQILFARARSGLVFGRNWRRVLEIMPIVLGYHKGIDELK
jgi:hypothetical protein